ncbi:PREDICTED: mitochondrial calcium uniporter regulator 1 [Dipodomys ordii]|uniref:Mitochondrial calcium uniporter regulator 1 n=1 Tax=Dipodomys ordii TaxID=10020 RepID=A0A1S3GC99_DIPOR|nr:PREDICTED: mitochondrial calcium uniporter regulator 1 [Dipodomys ordii]
MKSQEILALSAVDTGNEKGELGNSQKPQESLIKVIQRPGTVAHAHSPTIQEAEIRKIVIQGQPEQKVRTVPATKEAIELSLSAGCLQLEHKRRDFTSAGNRKLYFDTHALVCLLEENGNSLSPGGPGEITLQQIMSKIANVKKDMIILEKSEFSALRAENEKIKLELHQLKQQVMDEVIKVRTDTKLDFNLEKSRVKELHAQQDRALTQTDRKIETEVAGLKTMLEAHKLDTIKYLAGSVFTCLTVALGFYRLWI